MNLHCTQECSLDPSQALISKFFSIEQRRVLFILQSIAGTRLQILVFSVRAGAIAVTGQSFGDDTREIFLNDITCTGGELELLDCTYNNITNYTCPQYSIAGVVCQGKTTALQIRAGNWLDFPYQLSLAHDQSINHWK